MQVWPVPGSPGRTAGSYGSSWRTSLARWPTNHGERHWRPEFRLVEREVAWSGGASPAGAHVAAEQKVGRRRSARDVVRTRCVDDPAVYSHSHLVKIHRIYFKAACQQGG